MENCKAPTCVYNEKKKKCVKPNPYIQWIAHCRKTLKTTEKCKKIYNSNINLHKKKACEYYKKNEKNIHSTCPKNRIPINDKCSKEFPIKKLNKNGDECCYKERIKVEKIKPIKKLKTTEKTKTPSKTPEKTKTPSKTTEKTKTPSKTTEKTKTPSKTKTPLKTPEKPKPFFYDYKYERPEKIGKLNKIIYKYGDRAKPNKIPR